MPIDEDEFYRVLELFPVVRPRDYQLDLEASNRSASSSGINREEGQAASVAANNKGVDACSSAGYDAFWKKLKLAAEKKVGPAEAENFCYAFRHVYKKLVYEEMSLESARSFLNSTNYMPN